jgi:hypothetical protein
MRFSALIQNSFPSAPACFRIPTNSTGKSIVVLLVEFSAIFI